MRTVRPFAAVLALTVLISAGAPASNSGIPQVQGSALFGSVGFAWGEDGNSFAVARTKDAGTTWERLDTPLIALDTLGPGGMAAPSTVYVHWEDPAHGWLAWSTQDEVFHITNTTDGGTTWKVALAEPTDALLDGELYPSAGHACLRAQMAEGMMHTTTVLIATDDDGATWTVNSFPGDGVTGWMFKNGSVGFVSTLSPASAEIRLWRTSDGGKTWDRVPLSLPADMNEDVVAEVAPGSAVFSSDSGGTLTIRFALNQGKVAVTYHTEDEGLTWTPGEQVTSQ